MIFGRVLAFLVAAEVSGKRLRNSGRVVNGEDADIAEFPFYGALAPKRSMFMDPGKTHLAITCGSSLISPRFFITAYHCFLKHADPMYWVVIMGIRDRCQYDGKGRVLEVSWIYKHPQAQIAANLKMNDVALMMVSKPVIDVVPLALPVEPPRMNEKGYIIGFGLSKMVEPEGDVKDMACRPQKALEYVPDQKSCIKPKETIVGAFCIKDVYNRQAAACRGDSGGPYVVLRKGVRTLLGLSSFGDKLCKPSSNSDHFTDVHRYVEWINKMLHEPLPEGYKRMQEHIQQFNEPVGARGHEVGQSNALHIVSSGNVNMDDDMVRLMRQYPEPPAYAPHSYYSVASRAFNSFDVPVTLQDDSDLLGTSGNLDAKLGYQWPASGDAAGYWDMMNRAPVDPETMVNPASWYTSSYTSSVFPPDSERSELFNNVVQYGSVVMPQGQRTWPGGYSLPLYHSFGSDDGLSQSQAYDQSQFKAQQYSQWTS